MPYDNAADVVRSLHDSRVPDRIYLRLESGDSLEITPQIVIDYDLHQGRELSAQELSELKRDASRSSAKARALRVLSSRPMSRAELTDRLTHKGEDRDDAEEAADLMERVGFLDDEEYAHQVVRWCAGKDYGYHRAVSELGRRKVPREFWEAALTELPDPQEALDRLLKKKMPRSVDRDSMKKLTDALIRRGFDREEIHSAIRRSQHEFEYEEDG